MRDEESDENLAEDCSSPTEQPSNKKPKRKHSCCVHGNPCRKASSKPETPNEAESNEARFPTDELEIEFKK
ncbi:hypothetical protein Q1695_010225 [Nippostrongylus brasiliensis]|nr:hypothetical protein Q1695_010225 [Nippostrongylus brasiliensis]